MHTKYFNFKGTVGSLMIPPLKRNLWLKLCFPYDPSLKILVWAEVKEGVVGGTTFPYSGRAFNASGTSFGGLDPAP